MLSVRSASASDAGEAAACERPPVARDTSRGSASATSMRSARERSCGRGRAPRAGARAAVTSAVSAARSPPANGASRRDGAVGDHPGAGTRTGCPPGAAAARRRSDVSKVARDGRVAERRVACPQVDAGGERLVRVGAGGVEGAPAPGPDRAEPELGRDLPGGERVQLHELQPGVRAAGDPRVRSSRASSGSRGSGRGASGRIPSAASRLTGRRIAIRSSRLPSTGPSAWIRGAWKYDS